MFSDNEYLLQGYKNFTSFAFLSEEDVLRL